MSTVASPKGFQPVSMVGSRQNIGGGIREYAMTTNSAAGIFHGGLIQLSGGQPAAITATPTTSTTGIVGVCAGVSYTDPVLKYTIHAQFLPANAIANGYTNVRIKVIEDPDQLYLLQADGAVPATFIGANAQLSGFTGSVTTGNANTVAIASTVATTGTFAVRIVDMVNNGSSTPGDAFTDLIVRLNFGVHSYEKSGGA